MTKPLIYLIGSLRNPNIPKIGVELRDLEFNIFDEWIAAGPEADDYWRDYENQRGHTYKEALNGHPAKHVFSFDEFHLNRCHAGVLVYPAGKSGHLELGFLAGAGKPCFILLDELPDRYDVMKQFAQIFTTKDALKDALTSFPWPKLPVIPEVYQHEAMWLAGLIEGDGCFSISDAVPRLAIQMTDLDVIEKAARILKSSVWGGTHLTKGNKKVWACGTSGLTAVEWMRILKPYMGARRQQQIRRVVTSWLENKVYRKQDNKFWESVFNLGMPINNKGIS